MKQVSLRYSKALQKRKKVEFSDVFPAAGYSPRLIFTFSNLYGHCLKTGKQSRAYTTKPFI